MEKERCKICENVVDAANIIDDVCVDCAEKKFDRQTIKGNFVKLIPKGNLLQNLANIVGTTLKVLGKDSRFAIFLVNDNDNSADDGIVSNMSDDGLHELLEISLNQLQERMIVTAVDDEAKKSVH